MITIACKSTSELVDTRHFLILQTWHGRSWPHGLGTYPAISILILSLAYINVRSVWWLHDVSKKGVPAWLSHSLCHSLTERSQHSSHLSQYSPFCLLAICTQYRAPVNCLCLPGSLQLPKQCMITSVLSVTGTPARFANTVVLGLILFHICMIQPSTFMDGQFLWHLSCCIRRDL